MVLGYLVGYAAIAFVLLPIYYKLNLTSIYKYLDTRFSKSAYKTGSAFFLISRTIGAAFRLYLVAIVLQIAFFDAFKIPFAVTVITTIIMIWLYTHRAGIKTIVWTDTLQTTFLILAVIISIVIIGKDLNLDTKALFNTVVNHDYSKIFFWDWHDKHFFFKDFFSGAFIAFVMTGLDQDMMQKNLTVKTLKESQKNMIWMSISLVPVNLLFLSLGVLLYVYAGVHNVPIPERSDYLFPLLAIHHFGTIAGIVFLLGIIAAAFSSADSAITALTTAFAIDFLNFDIKKDDKSTKSKKTLIHLGVSVTLLIVILLFKALNKESVISQIFTFAGYTYGPLLGLFLFGIISKRKVKGLVIPIIAILSPILTFLIKFFVQKYTSYVFGFELLILNGFITYIGLLIASKSENDLSLSN